jgi:EAL domain-containing protein (putative c-di-GMP-specific phosphodiesterase class I)
MLSEIKRMGVSLALDDFGTGYSSLSYLRRFPIDKLKIDRSFVRDTPAVADAVELTSAIIGIAKRLKLRVNAEGVETRDQAQFLRSEACDELQGYLFSAPVVHCGLPFRQRKSRPPNPYRAGRIRFGNFSVTPATPRPRRPNAKMYSCAWQTP